jgi:hypothetical protein
VQRGPAPSACQQPPTPATTPASLPPAAQLPILDASAGPGPSRAAILPQATAVPRTGDWDLRDFLSWDALHHYHRRHPDVTHSWLYMPLILDAFRNREGLGTHPHFGFQRPAGWEILLNLMRPHLPAHSSSTNPADRWDMSSPAMLHIPAASQEHILLTTLGVYGLGMPGVPASYAGACNQAARNTLPGQAVQWPCLLNVLRCATAWHREIANDCICTASFNR